MVTRQETHHITTSMGKLADRSELPFLSESELEGFNNIGEESTKTEFLNSLGKGKFTVTMTQMDSGDFVEKFLIHRAWVETSASTSTMTSDQILSQLYELKGCAMTSIAVLLEKHAVKNKDGSLEVPMDVSMDNATIYVENDECSVTGIFSSEETGWKWKIHYTNNEIQCDDASEQEYELDLLASSNIEICIDILSALEEKG